jgi:hypothetical protein
LTLPASQTLVLERDGETLSFRITEK